MNIKNFRKKRYVMYLTITIIAMVTPFITINEGHIFLLSFETGKFHIFGIIFDIQELYLMPFLLIILFVGVLLLTTLIGRAWCGWLCPQTIFRTIYRDLIETKLLRLRQSINNKQKDINQNTKNKIKQIIAIIIWIVLAFIIASNFLLYFIPPRDFFNYILDIYNHKILLSFLSIIILFLIIDVIFIKENFCIYMCPYSRVQSVLYDNDTKSVIYDINRGSVIYKDDGSILNGKEISGECIDCKQCVKVCPTHIDIRKGLQLECINCLECVDACSSVMARFSKNTLIDWNSFNGLKNNTAIKYIRAKTIGYALVILIAIISIYVLISNKSTMLLNITRTSESYNILDNGNIENHYMMLFQNIDVNPHKYYLEVINNDDIKINKPNKPFIINPNEKVRKRVFLYSNNKDKKGIYPIKIKAYAIDNKDIFIIKESIFVYPK